MKKQFLCLLALFSIVTVWAQTPPEPYGVLPSERQISWHETDRYAIIHFGLATYTNKEWGYGDEDKNLFNPTLFDADKIISDLKEVGFNGVVVVAKHHDGFCLWPTKTTEYNLTNSPWGEGRRDMINEYYEACKKQDFKLGLYCSPWDRNNEHYGTSYYVDSIYRPQLKELYSNYGDLFMSWHDGANGGDGFYGGANEVREIDRTTYYRWGSLWKLIRNLQPNACIFGDAGPDVRWVGNEEGFAGETSWATYSPEPRTPGTIASNGATIYQLGVEGTRNGKFWMPAECDVPIRPGWFYHETENSQVKTPNQLIDLYYKSVGRGACLDLGLSLDHDGLLPEVDLKNLKRFNEILNKIFEKNLIEDCSKMNASHIRASNSDKYGPQLLLDNDRYSYWSTDDEVLNPELEVEWNEPITFNLIQLRENIKLGQRIDRIGVDAWIDSKWKEVAQATSIGSNRLIKIDKPIETSKIRLRIVDAAACIALSDFGLYYDFRNQTIPSITRDKNGIVKIKGENNYPIYYTMDGTIPNENSQRYKKPFQMESAGTISAIQVISELEQTEISREFFTLPNKKWRVYLANNKKDKKSIDNDPKTVLHYPFLDNSFTIDMNDTHNIQGFTYLPRQDKGNGGVIDKYEFYTSKDGIKWVLELQGEFSNIRSNPIQQRIFLPKNKNTRYVRLIATSIIEGSDVSIAELGCF